MPAAKPKSLVIVESPAKAKTISRFLSDDYIVEASYGHVRDLPQSAKEIPAAVRKHKWSRLGVNVEQGFEPVYVVPSDKKKHVKRLKDALKNADRLLLATDEDREGESISWHVLQLLKPKKSVNVQRIVFHEVTPEAIEAALASPRAVDDNLVRAQEARRVLDRLYGYSLSPLLWKRVAPGLSAGRVQSVAVRLTVGRERRRIAFISSDYWDLAAQLDASGEDFSTRLVRVDGQRLVNGKSFDPKTGQLGATDRLHLDEQAASKWAALARDSDSWKVSSLEKKPGTRRPLPPFITSTLQQEGNRKLRMTSRQTMRIAQQLYEGIEVGGGERTGLITYMRTDSFTLAGRAVTQAREVIASVYGEDYLPAKPNVYKTKAKRAEEAHEAIRPTDLSRRPQDLRSQLDDDQFRLYELIWKRTLACQMVPAQFERTALEIDAATSEGTLTFSTSGKQIVFPGFLRAYVEGSDDPRARLGDQEVLLPALTQGQQLRLNAVEAESHRTRPPARFTEASLVKKLEEEGIGRPSTYASIISTIQDRGYVSKKGNELVPTFTAFCVTQLLEQQFRDLVDTQFTAQMEDELDSVAAGKIGWDKLVSEFYLGADGAPGLEKRVSEGEVSYPAVAIGLDPDNGEPIVVKVGRYGPYVRRGEGGKENVVTVPDGIAPDELTLKLALELLASKSADKPPVAQDPTSGRAITLQRGRFGEYLELGQTEEEKEEKLKPRRVSLPKGLSGADLTEKIAIQLIQLPRTLGQHPETEQQISTGLGRYGPFLKHGSEFRSLETWNHACELGLAEAIEILKTPKPARRGFGAPKKILKELGELPDAAGPVKILDGRYGPYVTDGKTNASLPKGTAVDSFSAEQAQELLAKKRAAPKKKRRTRPA